MVLLGDQEGWRNAATLLLDQNFTENSKMRSALTDCYRINTKRWVSSRFQACSNDDSIFILFFSRLGRSVLSPQNKYYTLSDIGVRQDFWQHKPCSAPRVTRSSWRRANTTVLTPGYYQWLWTDPLAAMHISMCRCAGDRDGEQKIYSKCSERGWASRRQLAVNTGKVIGFSKWREEYKLLCQKL